MFFFLGREGVRERKEGESKGGKGRGRETEEDRKGAVKE